MNTDIIRVTQLPVIEEQLRAFKDRWEQEEQDAKASICTDETIQAVKKSRAEMRKDHEEIDTQRKAAKAQYMAPWARIDAAYKDADEAFNRADEAYKSKIDAYENGKKSECEDGLREYFAELCAVNHLEWMRYEDSGVKVDMAAAKQKTPKKLREQLAAFVTGVALDVDAISDEADAAEIMGEYKRNGLNLPKAIKTVREWHESAERERKAAEERAERQKRQDEAVADVEALAPPVAVEPPQETEKECRCTFTVYTTKEKLKGLKQYMIQEGIRYGAG